MKYVKINSVDNSWKKFEEAMEKSESAITKLIQTGEKVKNKNWVYRDAFEKFKKAAEELAIAHWG